MVPEGKSRSGWRGFGLHLRKAIDLESLAPKQATTGIPNKDASISYTLVVAGKQKNTSGGRDEGKNKTALVQNSNPRDFSHTNCHTCKESILGREQLGVKIFSDFTRNNRDPCKKSILGQREQVGVMLLLDLSRDNRDSCKVSTLGQRELLRAKVLSTLKEIESDTLNTDLSLGLFMRLERGLDGRWEMGYSVV